MNKVKVPVYKITRTTVTYVIDLNETSNPIQEIADYLHSQESLEAMEVLVLKEEEKELLVETENVEVDQEDDGYIDFDEHPLNQFNKVDAELAKIFQETK